MAQPENNMTKQQSEPNEFEHFITRRKFLGTTALSSAALLSGGITTLLQRSALAGNFDFLEKNIPELQAAMASGEVSSEELVMDYLQRIDSLNRLLHSVIETNPDAISIAEHLDRERQRGHVRSPLHGIPILVKDNIATEDRMETTAGSLALLGSSVPADAVIIQRLRAAGAIILGKTNLGEWANFRGTDVAYPQAVGWSARGGNTINADPLELYFMGIQFWFGQWCCSKSVLGGSRNRDGRVNYRSVCRREYRWVETDPGTRFARWDYSNFASARQRRADGTQRYRHCDITRRVAVALWRGDWTSASE